MNLYFWENAFQIVSLTCAGVTLISGVLLYTVKLKIKETEKVQKALDKEKIVLLETKVRESEQKVFSASATFKGVLSWDVKSLYGHTFKSMVQGNAGYIAFVKGTTPLVLIRSSFVSMQSDDSKTVNFLAHLDLSSPGSEVNTSLIGLKEADFVQVGLYEVKEPAILLSGSAEITFNNDRKVSLKWEKQAVVNSWVITKNVSPLSQM